MDTLERFRETVTPRLGMIIIDHRKTTIEENKLLWHVYVPEKYCWSVVLKSASTTIGHRIADDLGIIDRSPNSNEWLPYATTAPKMDVFRFAFVRNPYSRLVSYWAMRTPNKRNLVWGGESFEEFLDFHLAKARGTDFHTVSQLRTLHPKPDFIGKIENFDEDWSVVRKETGMPHMNGKMNSVEHLYGDWRQHYNNGTKKLVYKAYQEEFETLGYKAEL